MVTAQKCLEMNDSPPLGDLISSDEDENYKSEDELGSCSSSFGIHPSYCCEVNLAESSPQEFDNQHTGVPFSNGEPNKIEPMQEEHPQKVWKKHLHHQKRLRGESYLGFRGIEHAARPLLPSPCTNKNKHQCTSLVSEQQRQDIYDNFRNMSSIDEQRNFIVNHVEQVPKKRTTTKKGDNSRRTNTNTYHLTISSSKITVCREFFMATLNVTDAFMRTSLKKRTKTGLVSPDLRGRHTPHNKLSKETENFIREFLSTFPAVEEYDDSHENTEVVTKYLDGALNISILYRIFTKQCAEKGLKKISFEKFRQIFRECNLDFYHPKKGKCKTSLIYHNLTPEDATEKESYF